MKLPILYAVVGIVLLIGLALRYILAGGSKA